MATSTLTRPTASQPSRPTRRGIWSRLFGWLMLALLTATVLGGVGLVLLAYADYDMAGNGSSDPRARIAWVLERGDHLHFTVHMLQARVFDVCPCTRRAAGVQYYEAHFHALTPHQRELAANTHPHTPSEWAAYVAGPVIVVGDWLHDGLTWLSGQRPNHEATVVMDDFEFQPAEIHIARGTQVVWRNVDEQGEPHTVISETNLFHSDFVLPDEFFMYTFTERGRYVYFCDVHGGPGQKGMYGVVVVE